MHNLNLPGHSLRLRPLVLKNKQTKEATGELEGKFQLNISFEALRKALTGPGSRAEPLTPGAAPVVRGARQNKPRRTLVPSGTERRGPRAPGRSLLHLPLNRGEAPSAADQTRCFATESGPAGREPAGPSCRYLSEPANAPAWAG